MARSVWWRSTAVRLPPVSSRNRSSRRRGDLGGRHHARSGPRRARSPAGCRRGGGRSARPRPRSLRRARTRRRRRARDRRTAATASLATRTSDARHVVGDRRASERAIICSPATPRPSRLVASTRTLGARRAGSRRRVARRLRAGARSCRAPAAAPGRAARRRCSSVESSPGRCGTPRSSATTSGHRVGVAQRAELDTATRRRGNPAAAPRRPAIARRVFPTPADAGERHEPDGRRARRSTSAIRRHDRRRT